MPFSSGSGSLGESVEVSELDAALAARVPAALPVSVAEGGTASATAAAARTALGLEIGTDVGSEADTATALATAGYDWTDDLPEDPGNPVYVEQYVTRASTKIGTVAVMVPALGASAAGTYVFDVLVNGTSALTGTIDLDGVVAGTWSTGTVKSDGTENLSIGDELRVIATSDNADLTGYDEGLFFTVGMVAQ